MILHQLFLFGICLAFGMIARLVYRGVTKLESYIGLRVITIVFDVVMTGFFAIAFVLLLFLLNDGAFMLYTLISVVIGFVLISLWI